MNAQADTRTAPKGRPRAAARGEDLSGFPRSGEHRESGPGNSVLKTLGLRRVLRTKEPAAATPPGRLLAIAHRVTGSSALPDQHGGFVAPVPAVRFQVSADVHFLPPTRGTLTPPVCALSGRIAREARDA